MIIRRRRDREFEQQVRQAFAFLGAGSEPRVTDSSYEVEHFGNAVVILAGDLLRVRVTRDRSQIFVDLAPLGHGDWFDEDVVLQLVGAQDEAQALSEAEWKTVERPAAAISRHHAAIAARFEASTWEATKMALVALQERRATRLFGVPPKP